MRSHSDTSSQENKTQVSYQIKKIGNKYDSFKNPSANFDCMTEVGLRKIDKDSDGSSQQNSSEESESQYEQFSFIGSDTNLFNANLESEISSLNKKLSPKDELASIRRSTLTGDKNNPEW